MNDLQVVVSVSDKYLWALAPFSYLFNKYWSKDVKVKVAGYARPDFELPPNFSFFSIAEKCYPKEMWVDGVLKFLYQYDQDFFVFLLEDYWLCRKVDYNAVNSLADYMNVSENCLRIDLTTDRLYAAGMKDIGYFREFDIVEAKDSPYQMSLQAGIWSKRLMIDVLYKLESHHHSAWDVEFQGNSIISECNMQVVGTRQCPVRYVNGMNNGKGTAINFSGFTEEDRDKVKEIINGTVRSD